MDAPTASPPAPPTPPALPGAACPRCREPFTADGTRRRCAACGWTGRVSVFTPPPGANDDRPELAGIDDATCTFHPDKKATAICEGTGSYICALCAVEVRGRTFSAEYINTGGDPTVTRQHRPALPRPDRYITLLSLAIILFWPATVITTFFVIYGFVKHLRMLRTDSVYRDVHGPWGNAGLAILMGIHTLAGIGSAFFIVSLFIS